MNSGPSFQAGNWYQEQRHSKHRGLDPHSQGALVQRGNGHRGLQKGLVLLSGSSRVSPIHPSTQGLANPGLGRTQRGGLWSPCT